MVIGFYNIGESSQYAHLTKLRYLTKVLIQMWVASFKTTNEGLEYTELTTHNKPFYILPDDGGGLASYRLHSLAHTITVQEEDEDYDEYDEDQEDDNINKVKDQKPEGVISRVFRSKKAEISHNISYYSMHEYPDKDFALNCGIRASLCIPFFSTDDWFVAPEPDGVLEFVSTADYQVNPFRELCRKSDVILFREIKLYLQSYRMYGLSEHNRQPIVEMEHLLKLVCQTFPIPLAQCWVIRNTNVGALGVIHQESNIEFQNISPWTTFKYACFNQGLNIDEGPVGKSYISHRSYLCRDITEFSITKYPLAHYASECGSVACFTICVCSFTPLYRECVLEFFLPSQGMNSNYLQTLLNSLLVTMKKHLPNYMVASGEQLGQVLSVKVIKFSTHDEPEYIQIGQPLSSFTHHVESENERGESHQLPHSLHLLLKDGNIQDENFQNTQNNNNSNINFREETATGEKSKRTPNNVADIAQVDELEDESLVRCIEPQSQNYQPMRSKESIEAEENTVEMDHSAPEMRLEETIKHKEHTLIAERVYELVEDSPVEYVAYAMSEDDLGYASSSEKDINFESVSKHFGRPLDDAAKSFGVSRSTFKRICRGLGIKRWRSGKRRMRADIPVKLGKGLNDGKSSRKNFSCSGMAQVVADASQDLIKMTVKATYMDVTIRFELPDISGFAGLEENVIERLHLERKSFNIKYQDEEGDWVLLACDKDVRECMQISRSLNKTTIKMLIDLSINPYAL